MTVAAREPLRVLVFSASLRSESLNTRLAHLAAEAIEVHGATADRAAMRDFDAPSYDGDAEATSLPVGARALRERLEAADAFVIASPEYNATMPGALKNAIDWVSRARPQPFNERHGLLLSASPSMVGGNRGLWSLRVPPSTSAHGSTPQAHHAFDDAGRIADERLRARFDDTVANFLDLVEASTHYPCVKRAWVEFLGERPDAALDRVDT